MNLDYPGLRPYKKEIKELNHFFKHEKVNFKILDEKSLFQARLIKKSIELKEKIDTIFYFESNELRRVSVNLTFHEKNQIIKDMIQQTFENYDIINVDNREILFPIFSQKINDIYIHQPASLEMPIYQKFIKEYQDELDFSLFDELIYHSDFFDGFKHNHFIYYNNFKLLVFGSNSVFIENSNALEVINAIENDDKLKLVELLWNGTESSKKKKKLEKIRGKYNAFK